SWGSSGTAGGCDECKKDTKGVQLYSADRAAWSVLLGPGGGGTQKNSKPGLTGSPSAPHSFGQVRVRNSPPAPRRKKRVVDEFVHEYGPEQETNRFSEQSLVSTSAGPAHRLATAPPAQPAGDIDHQGDSGGTDRNRHKGQARVTEPDSEPSGYESGALRRLLEEDDSNEFASGQLRKTDFLDQLETAVRAAADSE